MNQSSSLYGGSIEDFAYTNKIMKIGFKNSTLIDLYFSSKFENTANSRLEASISKITINRTDSSHFHLTKNVLHCDSVHSTDP